MAFSLPRFSLCTHALCEAIVASLHNDEKPDAESVAAVSSYVLAQHARMPDYLRLPFKLVAWFFDMTSTIRGGQLCHQCSLDARIAVVQAWRNGRWGFQRDFIRFYETLAIFAWYAWLDEQPVPTVGGTAGVVTHG